MRNQYKLTPRWQSFFAAATVSFITVTPILTIGIAPAGSMPLTTATLRKVVKKVRLIPLKAAEQEAQVGQKLSQEGDAVRTHEASRVDLKFNDGTLAKVGELATFRFVPNTRRFELGNGKFLFLVPPGQGNTEFNTPNATAGVRGSALFIQYDRETNTTLMGALTNNPLGPMSITAGGQRQDLYGGQMAIVVKNRIESVQNFDLSTFLSTSSLFRDVDFTDPDLQAVRQEVSDALQTQVAGTPAIVPVVVVLPEPAVPSLVNAQPIQVLRSTELVQARQMLNDRTNANQPPAQKPIGKPMGSDTTTVSPDQPSLPPVQVKPQPVIEQPPENSKPPREDVVVVKPKPVIDQPPHDPCACTHPPNSHEPQGAEAQAPQPSVEVAKPNPSVDVSKPVQVDPSKIIQVLESGKMTAPSEATKTPTPTLTINVRVIVPNTEPIQQTIVVPASPNQAVPIQVQVVKSPEPSIAPPTPPANPAPNPSIGSTSPTPSSPAISEPSVRSQPPLPEVIPPAIPPVQAPPIQPPVLVEVTNPSGEAAPRVNPTEQAPVHAPIPQTSPNPSLSTPPIDAPVKDLIPAVRGGTAAVTDAPPAVMPPTPLPPVQPPSGELPPPSASTVTPPPTVEHVTTPPPSSTVTPPPTVEHVTSPPPAATVNTPPPSSTVTPPPTVEHVITPPPDTIAK